MKRLRFVFSMLVIASLVLGACARPEETTTDFSFQITLVGYLDDYESDPSRDGAWSNIGTFTTDSNQSGFTDPTSSGISGPGQLIGKFETYDEGVKLGVSLEDLTIRDQNQDIILYSTGRETGYVDNEESNRIYNADGILIAEITEKEKFLDDNEQEAIYLIDADGQRNGVANVTEFGSGIGREAIRNGTEVADYRYDQDFIFKTEFDTARGTFVTSGSTISVNGKPVMVILVESGQASGITILDTLSLQTVGGKEICRVLYDDQVSKESAKISFSCDGQPLGDVFVRVTDSTVSRTPSGDICLGDSGCSVKTHNLSWNMAGETLEEKLQSLRVIDYILAMMPDQVNKNFLSLHEVEEFGDVMMILLDQDMSDEELAQAGVALRQEEDGLTVFEAYQYINEHFVVGQ